MTAEQRFNEWGQIVAKAWQDDAFRKRLVANPSATLKAEGFEVPSGVEIRVVENTDKLVYVTLPARPLEDNVSDDELEDVAGGSQIKPKSLTRGALGGILHDLAKEVTKVNIDFDKLPQDTGPKPV